MKKKLYNALGILCVGAIFAACCITDRSGDPCIWNYILLALSALCGIGCKRLEKEVRRG